MPAMKIVHVTPLYHPFRGGAESYTKEVSERLARRGHDVTVLALNECLPQTGRRNAPLEVLNGVTVQRFDGAGRMQGLLGAAALTSAARRALAWTAHADAVESWARSPYGFAPALHAIRANPDVVTVINWYGGWLPLQACLARRLRRFALVGVPLFHTEGRWSREPLQGQLLRRFDAVVAMTDHERVFVRPFTDRARTIGVGVDETVFSNADGHAVRSRYDIGDAPLVGYIGRMVASKGIDVLIRAMKNVWRQVPEARLLLAGGGASRPDLPLGFPSPSLDSLSAGERSRVIITGPFSDDEKSSLFDSLDVFAMPSRAESFGIAYLEAWLRSKPVIGARLGSTECIIDHGTDGELVAPDDSDELAACILRLLGDPERRVRLGSMGRAKTIARFTWDKVTDAIERLYLDTSGRLASNAAMTPDAGPDDAALPSA
jgi:glycosyltransferase involved in cell wall biosynthesis